MKKYSAIFLLLFSCTFIHSYLFSDSDKSCCDRANGYIIDACCIDSGYNAPDKLCLKCPFRIYLEGSFIWWQAREGGLNVSKTAGSQTKDVFIDIPFSYEPGFKVKIGYNFCRDDWMKELEYTRFYSTQKVSLSNKPMYPLWSVPPSPNDNYLTNSVISNWNLKLNILDFSLGRRFYNGLRLSLHPFIGLKGGWVDQQIFLSYKEYLPSKLPNEVEIFVCSDSWVIGPKFGTSLNFILHKYVTLFAKAACSALYQDFDSSFKQTRQNSPDISSKNEISYFNPFLEMCLGLNFGSYLASNRIHWDLRASYDFNIFWNQNMMRSNLDSYKKYVDGASGDLVLHGLTLSLRLDF